MTECPSGQLSRDLAGACRDTCFKIRLNGHLYIGMYIWMSVDLTVWPSCVVGR